MAFLRIEGLTKTFKARDGSRFIALKDVNLEIDEGEFVSVIGHSGCGKSTMLNLVAGLDMPSLGVISVGNDVVRGPGPDRMVAFQNHSLLPWLTLRKNVALAVDRVHQGLSGAARARMVDEHLAMVKLTPAADRYPHQVSGGMKQRCGIARALSTKPKVLLLDEPFGALDALTRAKLQDELLTIWERERITVMMITHDVDEALLLSDRIVMMSNGPAANIAEIMPVALERPRNRLEVIDNPNYYRQRDELLYFLQSCKSDKRKRKRTSVSGVERVAASAAASTLERPAITVGFVPLVDCAPFALAESRGLFEKHGLDVTLSRERSWKTVADGVTKGRLDAAQMVVGMPFAHGLGLGNAAPNPLEVAMMLSRGGNAITIGQGLVDDGVADGASLARLIAQRREQGAPKLIFGMVHPGSMHNLMLRAWLADVGVDPDVDVELTVIPPPQMVANLEQKNIAGYCVGEPWNQRAIAKNLGRVLATDYDLWPDHPEKVLGVTSEWSAQNPETMRALVRALLEACQLCDDPQVRAEVLPPLLSDPKYVGGSPEDFAPCLSGPYDYGDGSAPRTYPGFVSFAGDQGNACRPNESMWVIAQLARWGLVAFPTDPEQALQSIVPCALLDEALSELGMHTTNSDESPIRFGAGPEFNPKLGLAYLESVNIKRPVRMGQNAATAA